jgi:hypothetical protein
MQNMTLAYQNGMPNGLHRANLCPPILFATFFHFGSISTNMSTISAKLKHTTTWGSGLTSWAVYVIECSYEGNTWTVYRRYSAWEALHGAILGIVDPVTKDYLIRNFPEKEFSLGSLGSFVGTFSFVVDQRKDILKRYLSLLLMHPKLITTPILLSFLDSDGRGASGIARSLGPSAILLEAVVDMTLPTMANLVWSANLLVLTRNGRLYALEEYYSDESAAFLTLDLSQGGRIAGVSDRQVELHGGSTYFTIDFRSPNVMANWVRSISEIMMRADPHDEILSYEETHSGGGDPAPVPVPAQGPASQRVRVPTPIARSGIMTTPSVAGAPGPGAWSSSSSSSSQSPSPLTPAESKPSYESDSAGMFGF